MAARPPATAFVWHPGSLGDVLLALPAIRALRTAYPRHALHLAAQEEVGALLQDCGEVSGVSPLGQQGLVDLYAGSARVRGRLGDTLGRCEIAVCWLADHDGRVRRSLAGLGIARIIVRSPHDAALQAAHQTERFLDTLAPLKEGLASRGPLRLSLPLPVDEAGARRLEAVREPGGAPCAVIHPGSGSPHKCCPPVLLAEIIEGLRDHGFWPVLVVGPADGGISARVHDCLSVAVPSFQGMGLAATAGLLAAADLYVGHDSGITHLAAALGVPTVALFGPTAAARWAPRGQAVAVLSGPPCRCEGWPAIRACRDKPCLKIPVESVLSTSRQVLSRRATGRIDASV